MAPLGEQGVDLGGRGRIDASGALHDFRIAEGLVVCGHVCGVGDKALARRHAPMQGDALILAQHFEVRAGGSTRPAPCITWPRAPVGETTAKTAATAASAQANEAAMAAWFKARAAGQAAPSSGN